MGRRWKADSGTIDALGNLMTYNSIQWAGGCSGSMDADCGRAMPTMPPAGSRANNIRMALV